MKARPRARAERFRSVRVLASTGEKVLSGRTELDRETPTGRCAVHYDDLEMRRTRHVTRSLRGATKVEYAILLFLLLILAAIVFKVVGSKVGHAGNETVQRFDGKGGDGKGGDGKGGDGKGGKAGAAGSAGGAASAGGTTGPQVVAANGGGAGGAGGGAGGNAGSGGGGSGGGGGGTGAGNGSVETNDAPAEEGGSHFPLMKILAGLFVTLFAAAAFFAFRKGKGSS